MKLFFISDIHGSSSCLQKALGRFEAEKADFIIILGDELYHGARNPLPEGYSPKDVAGLLNRYSDKIIAVRGNCDSEVDAMVLNFPVMSDFSTIFYNEKRLFLTHGHLFGEQSLPPLRPGDSFFYGHTHIPVAKEQNGIYILNPGSVSIPKEQSPRSYGILNEGVFSVKDLDGEAFLKIRIA